MKLGQLLITCFICAGLIGCAMVDPYEPLAKGQNEYKDLPEKALTLPQAVGYARAVRMDYIKKIQAENKDVSQLGVATMILAGVIGADTIIDRSDDLITIGSIAGVTGLSAAEWLSSDTRIKLYALGAAALTCAVEAVVPLQGVEGSDINSHKDKIAAELVNVQEFYQQATLLQQGSPEPMLSLLIEQNLADARGQVTAAQKIYKNGAILKNKLQSAGTNLQVTVDDINNRVLLELIEDQRDIKDLREVIKGLVVQATGFVDIPGQSLFTAIDAAGVSSNSSNDFLSDPEDHKKLNKKYRESVSDTLGKLRVALAKLNSVAFELDAVVSSVTHSYSEEKLKNCGVDVISPLTVSKGEIVFVKGVDFVDSFVISGGSKEYSVQTDPLVTGISAQQTEHFGARVTVKAIGAELALGNYSNAISVSDDKKQKQYVAIRVIDSPGAVNKAGRTDKKDTEFCQEADNKKTSECVIQDTMKHFNLFDNPQAKNVDGKCGKATLSAMRKFQLLLVPKQPIAAFKCDVEILKQFAFKITQDLPLLAPLEGNSERGVLLLHTRMLKEKKTFDQVSQIPLGQAEIDFLNEQVGEALTPTSQPVGIRDALKKRYVKHIKTFLRDILGESTFEVDTVWTEQDTQKLENSTHDVLKGKITSQSDLYKLIEIIPVLYSLQ